jgi:hypothetical protein
MVGLIIFAGFVVGLVVLDMIAMAHGADSRPGFDTDRIPNGVRTF